MPPPPVPIAPPAPAMVAVIPRASATATPANTLATIDESSPYGLDLAAGDRALWLRYAICASAKAPELRHRVDSLVTVSPSDKHRRVAEARKLPHPHRRRRHV